MNVLELSPEQFRQMYDTVERFQKHAGRHSNLRPTA